MVLDVNVAVPENPKCVVWMWWVVGDVCWYEWYGLVYGWMILSDVVWDVHVVVLEISQCVVV